MRIGWENKNYFTAETQKAPRKPFLKSRNLYSFFTMGNNGGATDSKSVFWVVPTIETAKRFILLSTDLELFAKSEALPLIRRSYADAVNLFRRLQQSHVCQTRDDLAVFNQKRHFMCSDLQDGARPRKIAHSVTEARVEETGIVYPELTY